MPRRKKIPKPEPAAEQRRVRVGMFDRELYYDDQARAYILQYNVKCYVRRNPDDDSYDIVKADEADQAF